MKRSTFLYTTTLTVVILFALAASQALAQGLSQPLGLALDANGNLYVANYGNNNSQGSIVVYNPKYVQQTKKTITQAVVKPSGVAIDSQGNIFVSNSLSGTVTKYDANGNWQSGATLTQNIVSPTGIAIDAFDDIWVNNGAQFVTFYSPEGVYLGSSTPGGQIDSIATGGQWYVVGQDSTWMQLPMSQVLTNNGIAGLITYPSHNQAVAAAFNPAGNYFMAQGTGEVDVINPYTGARTFVVQVAYPPTGLVVDGKRGRLYLADRYNNTVDVYTTKGKFLKTIK